MSKCSLRPFGNAAKRLPPAGGITYRYGKVPVGFQSVVNPTLTVTVSGTAANGYQLINRADVGGKYQGTWQTGQATWLTIVRKLTPTYVPTLPKTGY